MQRFKLLFALVVLATSLTACDDPTPSREKLAERVERIQSSTEHSYFEKGRFYRKYPRNDVEFLVQYEDALADSNVISRKSNAELRKSLWRKEVIVQLQLVLIDSWLGPDREDEKLIVALDSTLVHGQNLEEMVRASGISARTLGVLSIMNHATGNTANRLNSEERRRLDGYIQQMRTVLPE